MKIQQLLTSFKNEYKKDKIIIFNVMVGLLSVAGYQSDFIRDNYQHYYLAYIFGITGLNLFIKNYENANNQVILENRDLIDSKAPDIVKTEDGTEKAQNFNSGSC